jgi:hypothetical protein
MPNVEPVSGFWVCEKFKDKSGYHIHGLIKLPKFLDDKENYSILLSAYQKATGMRKFHKWQRIDLRRMKHNTTNAQEYVSKYVSKSARVDYDFVIPLMYTKNQLKLEL